jgi:hypothetical protein
MTSATIRPASGSDPAYVRRTLRRHRPFLLCAALALSGLLAEEAWAATQFWSRLAPGDQFLLGFLVALVALVGHACAFLLPPALVHPENFTRPVGAFAQATALGIALAVVTNGVAFGLLLLLVSFNLDAVYHLLKDVYVYTLMAVLVHGLVYYVRHMHWLYDEFGGADSPFKPIAASGSIGAIILVVTIAFLPLDLQSVNAAAASLRGLVGLNVYVRDLYLLTLALGAYAWHLRWIADH